MGRLPGQNAPFLENPQLNPKLIAPVYMQKARNFAKTWKNPLSVAAGLGVSAFIILSDWRVIVDYIPIYNKQFKKADE